jgi:hypothetical protein
MYIIPFDLLRRLNCREWDGIVRDKRRKDYVNDSDQQERDG